MSDNSPTRKRGKLLSVPRLRVGLLWTCEKCGLVAIAYQRQPQGPSLFRDFHGRIGRTNVRAAREGEDIVRID